VDSVTARGRQVLAHVVGSNRQLTVAAVGEHRQLHPIRTSVLDERVDRSADGAAGVEDVVDEDHRAPLELELEPRVAYDRLRTARRATRADTHVVTMERDVELTELELDTGALLDESPQPLCERNAAGVDANERDGLEIVVAFDDLVRDPGERSCDLFGVQQNPVRGSRGMLRHSTPFRPRWTGLKGDVPAQHTRTGRTVRFDGLHSAIVEGQLLERYAKLVAEVGANIQPDQQVIVIAPPSSAPLVRAIAVECFKRGARFVDPWYFDPYVKRIRALEADPGTLEFVPRWYPKRLLDISEAHGSRISISPNTPPGLMAGVDPAVAGRDQLPTMREGFEVINAKTTNWCVVPWASETWATVVHPDLAPSAALAKLNEELVYLLRLDEPDAAAAWRERGAQLQDVGTRLTEHHFDALRFEGPGTDLTIGLLPTSRFAGGGSTNIDGVRSISNLPTEEVFTAPDPQRADGVVTATKPLDLSGVLVRGLRVRFEAGRVVEIEAESGAEALRARCAKDEGASRLGELALVDREGRIGKSGITYFSTLLDENAASHLALGGAYATSVGDEDRGRINKSGIHIDFMIGSDDVAVTGLHADGTEVPVLRGGTWQF